MASSSSATPTGAKRRRVEDSSEVEVSLAHRQVLDCLWSKLSLPKKNRDDNGDSVDSQLSSVSTFPEAMRQLDQDKELLNLLQDSLGKLVKKVEETKIKTHQQFSYFFRIDQDVRDVILSLLDEEGLWALEESHMMQLEENKAKTKWRELWQTRRHAFPDMSSDEDDEEDNHNNHNDLQDTNSCRLWGIFFGKASRMARCMGDLSQAHYGNSSPSSSNNVTTICGHSWPKHSCRALLTDRLDTAYFVRITYADSMDSDDPSLVVEGFTVILDQDIEPGFSRIHLELRNVHEDDVQRLFQRVEDAYNDETDDGDSVELAKRDMGNALTMTIVELGVCSDEHETELNLVTSTTGYSNEDVDFRYLDGDFLYLTPRSRDFQVRGRCFDDDEGNLIKVGLGLEDETNLQIEVTAG